jgi:hypothetical protein
VASGFVIASSAPAQTVMATLSDFQNFSPSVTYANWNDTGGPDSGYLVFNGGTGYEPTIILSGPFEVIGQGYGSVAHDFATPIDATGATEFQITFTINNTMAHGDGSGLWFGPNLDISDGTHMVHLTAVNAGAGYLNYGPYVGPGIYTLTGPLTDTFGEAPLDVSTITAFNVEIDPAEYGSDAPYDITYDSLKLIAVPEPTTLVLLALGATGFVIVRRRVSVT